MSEVNIFTLDPHGFKSHFKIVAGTPEHDLHDMIKQASELAQFLATHQYTPDDFGRGNGASRAAAPAPSAGSSGVAEWVINPDGSRSCSVHGPAKWVPPGTSKKTGKPYNGFWSCQTQGCKPRGDD